MARPQRSLTPLSLEAAALFSFRQRGAVWGAAGLEVPDPLPTAKFGSSVDLDGDLAVVGAPEFDNRGAVFVFVNQAAGFDIDAAAIGNHVISLPQHNLRSETRVVYTGPGIDLQNGQPGLATGESYYVIEVDSSTIKLAATATERVAVLPRSERVSATRAV